MRTNSIFCADWINFGNGIRWTTNVTVWFAGKIITGQQIQVAGGTRNNGPLRISCPSERCNSIPMDWVLPTNEILARVEMLAAKKHEAATSTPINHGRMPDRPHETNHGIAAQLRTFVSYFNRHS